MLFMKPNRLFVFAVASLLVFRSLPILAETSATFDVLVTFDYSNADMTIANAINNYNQVAGTFFRDSGEQYGFVYFLDKFSGPIADPNDRFHSTEVEGINNVGTLCGSYLGGDSIYHSFLRSGLTYTEIDIGPTDTIANGINDAGNICGATTTADTWIAFVVIDGTVTTFAPPGALVTEAHGINNRNECVGFSFDNTMTSGFRRSSDGILDYPITTEKSKPTYLYGMNGSGWMVGSIVDDGEHAILFQTRKNYTTYDYPGASLTRFTGINDRKMVTGFYEDRSGTHSFIARVSPAPAE